MTEIGGTKLICENTPLFSALSISTLLKMRKYRSKMLKD